MSCLPLLLVTIATVLTSGGAQRNIDYVYCPDQQEVCECSNDAAITECHFNLTIEELQTFTSYRFQGDTLVTRGTPGDTYYLDQGRFQWALQQHCNQTNSPECGDCGRAEYQTEEQFRPKCSVPMTVDGATYRLFIAVNGRIPGPTLVVNEDQIVVVNVVNKLTSEGITIHWHGMHQQQTPWMDGVAFISQAPIVPGAEFRYIFRARPAGTHWYHSHAGAQRTDGLFGALIVKEKEATIASVKTTLGRQFEDLPEHTLTFLDWQRESSLNLFVQLHSTLGFYETKPSGDVPNQENTLYPRTYSSDNVEVGPHPYWSGLINGRGRHTPQTPSKLSIFNVAGGQTYRFRLIGAQSLFAYKFSIDGHLLTVIASDGHFIHPTDVNFVIVHTGERYDVLVDADQEVGNYWIRADTLETNIDPIHSAEAILHYNNANDSNMYSNVQSPRWQCTASSRCTAINCPFKQFPSAEFTNCTHLHELRALMPSRSNVPQTVDPNQDKTLFFNFGFEGTSSTSAINGRNFRPPVTPYQTNSRGYEKDSRACRSRCESPDFEDCECTYLEKIVEDRMFDIENTETMLFVLSAVNENETRNNFSHPVHLHGHSFTVVDIGHGDYDDGVLTGSTSQVTCRQDPFCYEPGWGASPQPFQSVQNRILKDTVIVPAGGYVVIAFQADNPGYWFLHCHIESHQLEGMAVIIQEYDESIHSSPPNGINKVGDFTWTVNEFLSKTSTSLSGSPSNSPQPPPSNSPSPAVAFALYDISKYTICVLVVSTLYNFIFRFL